MTTAGDAGTTGDSAVAAAQDAAGTDAGNPSAGSADGSAVDATSSGEDAIADTSATDSAGPDAAGTADTGAGVNDVATADSAPTADVAPSADAAPSVDAGGSTDAAQAADSAVSKGACDNAADLKALAGSDPQKAIGGCVTKCFTPGPTCSGCLKSGLGTSDGCTACFAGIVDCTIKSCAMLCIQPTSKGCTDCQQQKCFPAFVQCAGVSPP